MDVLDNISSKKHASTRSTDIQDEIAKTYFHGAAKKPKKKSKWKTRLPWLIAALAFVFAIAIVTLRGSIDIKVRVMGEMPSVPHVGAPYSSEGSPDKGIFLIKGGEPNKDMAKDVSFNGDAKSFSLPKPEELVLCNSKGAGWANYSIELKEPIDLNKVDIIYTAKGTRGDEHLILVIGDVSKRVYRLEKDLSSSLSKDWHKYTMNFRRVNRAVDLSNINLIKFEFGNLTAGNPPGAAIFLKDIYITKTRRLKWL